MGDGGTKQVVLNFNKQSTDKRGWEAACGGETMSATPRMFATPRRRAGGGPGDQFDLRSEVDGVMTRPSHTTEEGKHS